MWNFEGKEGDPWEQILKNAGPAGLGLRRSGHLGWEWGREREGGGETEGLGLGEPRAGAVL